MRKRAPLLCSHRSLRVCTEPDGCSWVECVGCALRGPKKHSYSLALLAWLVRLSDHPVQVRR